VDVGTRRTLVAVTTTLAAATAAGAASGGSSGSRPSGGGNNGGGSGGGDGNSGRKEDEPEEEQEEAGGLEGPEGDDDSDVTYTRNSIFNYEEETMKIKSVNWLGLVKKFVNETAGLAFTLAGSAIMFVTLSGNTRNVAMVATGIALFVHYVHVMLKNDEE
jgi:hypothetical protein